MTKFNPYKFVFTNTKKIKFEPESDGKNSRVIKQEPGQYYLKCTYIVYFRSHDGYCSETEDPDIVGYELETQKLVVLHFSIPSDLIDESGSVKPDLLDSEANIIKNEHTEHYYQKWFNQSACSGTCVCKYTDLYWPQFIELVKQN